MQRVAPGVRFCSLGILLLASTALLASCAPAADGPPERAVVDFALSRQYGVIVTDATRRTILIDMERFAYCAEPSPDSNEDSLGQFAQALAAALRADTGREATGGIGLGAAVSAQVAQATASIARATFVPTQGAQLYRIGAFNLCQAWMNNAISDAEFARQHEMLVRTTSNLVLTELYAVRLGREDDVGDAADSLLDAVAALEQVLASLAPELEAAADTIEAVEALRVLLRDEELGPRKQHDVVPEFDPGDRPLDSE